MSDTLDNEVGIATGICSTCSSLLVCKDNTLTTRVACMELSQPYPIRLMEYPHMTECNRYDDRRG